MIGCEVSLGKLTGLLSIVDLVGKISARTRVSSHVLFSHSYFLSLSDGDATTGLGPMVAVQIPLLQKVAFPFLAHQISHSGFKGPSR